MSYEALGDEYNKQPNANTKEAAMNTSWSAAVELHSSGSHPYIIKESREVRVSVCDDVR